jgi:hypothetical protein
VHVPPSACFIVAALASLVLGIMHGVSGQRSFVSPLRRERLYPSPQWGDEDMTGRIFAITWHMVTAVFASCSVVLLLLAMDVLQGDLLPLFISALYAAFIVLAIVIVGPRTRSTVRRPYALVVAISLTTVCVGSWLGTQ